MKELVLATVVLIAPVAANAADAIWSYNYGTNDFTDEKYEKIGVGIDDDDVINKHAFIFSCSSSNVNTSNMSFRMGQRYVPDRQNTKLHVKVDQKPKFILNLKPDSKNNDWLGQFNQSQLELFKNGKQVRMLLERNYPLENIKLAMTLNGFNDAYDRYKHCLQ